MPEIRKIINRIKSLKSLKHDKEVAELLHLEPSTLAQRLRTSSVPYAQLVEFALAERISIDWLIKGDRSKEFCPFRDSACAGERCKFFLVCDKAEWADYETCMLYSVLLDVVMRPLEVLWEKGKRETQIGPDWNPPDTAWSEISTFGDWLAAREGYSNHKGLDAVHFYLIQKHHWLPSAARNLFQRDLLFLLREEYAAWLHAGDSTPRSPNGP